MIIMLPCVGGKLEVQLLDVLSFFTGASVVPPLGFDTKPSLYFNAGAVYPTASTCALHLTLPTKYYQQYEEFKAKMVQALTSHGGFGRI